MKYTVRFEHEDNGTWSAYAVEVPGAHSWGRSIAGATRQVTDAIATMRDLTEEETASIKITPTFVLNNQDMEALVVTARQHREKLEAAQAEASDSLRSAVAAISDSFSMRDVAAMTGVTHSRIQQIEAELALQ